VAEVGLIWADDADLRAIYNYVQDLRPSIPKFPGLQTKIEDFEQWYQGLTWSDIHVFINDTTAEAYRRRDEINRITNNVRPADWLPADRKDRAPGTASGLAGKVPPKPPLIPTWAKVTAVVTATATIALVVIKKFSILRFL
jgi:hypothetical protein